MSELTTAVSVRPPASTKANEGLAVSFAEFRDHRLCDPRRADERPRPLALDLFAGCGGLALGLESAGFKTIGFEMNADAAGTYEKNLAGPCHKLELSIGQDYPSGAAVVVGGPPCQPFSVGGLQRGARDPRDGFPIFLDAVERCRPQIAMFENVRGMLYKNRIYLESVVEALQSLGYVVHQRLLDAVEFGVPQRRVRLVVVATKIPFAWPHALAQGVRFTAGDALEVACEQSVESGRFLTPSMDAYVAKYERASKCVTPRDLHLHLPSRTVTCRNLSGATGDMLRIRLPDGRRRRVTPREGARLQSFPDWFTFVGTEGSVFKQIGNAVAPLLGYSLGRALLDAVNGNVDARAAEQLSLFSPGDVAQ